MAREIESTSEELINPLRKERVIVRRVPKTSGIWGSNPKHILSGGMADNAVKTFVVPILSSGLYKNVLTDNEKAYLEKIMGLEYNALSIYRKKDNFWDDSTDNGANKVRLGKGDTYLDLSIPEEYIKYKILLANENLICPSMQQLIDMPKPTYQFVIVTENEENKLAKTNMSATMQCYKEYGKVEDNADILKTIIETLEGKPLLNKTKLEFLQTKINTLIQADSKRFLKVITDPLLSTKVLIAKCIEGGLISKKGDWYYLKSDGSPLCNHNEDPILSVAAKYLNEPKHQELKFSLEAKLKE